VALDGKTLSDTGVVNQIIEVVANDITNKTTHQEFRAD
jgi:hypothetical protein